MATDSLGLRDDKPRTLPLVGTRRRMLFLGDFFTEGVGIPYEQTFVGIIRDRIRRAGGDVEVLNGGVASHSPRLYLLHLQDLIERRGAKFDEIVVFIDVSDIMDEIVYEEFTPGRITPILVLRYLHQFIVQHSLLANVLYLRLPATRSFITAIRSWMRELLERQAGAAPGLLVTPAAAQAAKPPLQADIMPPAREVWDNPRYYEIRDTWVDNDEAFRAWGAYGLKLARDNSIKLADYAASKSMAISFAIYPWPRFARHPDNRGRLAWTKIAAEQKWTLVDLYPNFAASSGAAVLHSERRALERSRAPICRQCMARALLRIAPPSLVRPADADVRTNAAVSGCG